MNTDIEKLIRLQTVDEEITHRSDAIAALPKRLAGLEADLAREQQTFSEIVTSLAKEEEDRQRIDASVKQHLSKLAKFRDQVTSVKTSEQLAAIEREISFAEAEVRKLEDSELESLSRSEELEKNQALAQKSVHQHTVIVDSERVQVQVAQTVHKARVQLLQKQRTQLRGEIDSDLLAKYDRIASARGTGMARAHDRQCLGCQMALRPQVWNQVREGVLLNCENCGRMLYWDPAKEAAEAKPPAGVSPTGEKAPKEA